MPSLKWTPISSAFEHWDFQNSFDFFDIQMEANSAHEMAKYLNFGLKDQTLRWVCFEIGPPEALENLSKTKDVLLRCFRKNDTVIRIWYTFLQCEARQNLFIEALAGARADCVAQWHSEPF